MRALGEDVVEALLNNEAMSRGGDAFMRDFANQIDALRQQVLEATGEDIMPNFNPETASARDVTEYFSHFAQSAFYQTAESRKLSDEARMGVSFMDEALGAGAMVDAMRRGWKRFIATPEGKEFMENGGTLGELTRAAGFELERIYEKSKVTAENLATVLEARAAARGEATVSEAEVEEVNSAMEAEQEAIANEQMPSVKPEESASEDVSTEELEAMFEQQNASLDEEGKLVPPPGCLLETDAEGAGRGLYVGEFSRMADGSLLGSADTDAIQLSPDVPQVERKGGRKYDHFRKDYAPITVWRRADGRLELITGQRRLAAAKENGEAHVAVRVFDEDAAHDARWARLFHAEQNIRDKQATVEQVAYYYRETGLTDAQAEERGLLPRDRNGRPLKTLTMGATIARMGSEAVYADLLAGKLTPKEAYAAATKEQPGEASMAVDIEAVALEEQEIIARAKEESSYMKAPNGKKSNLTPKQWAQVRTQAFKNYFGDWERKAELTLTTVPMSDAEVIDSLLPYTESAGHGIANLATGIVATIGANHRGKIISGRAKGKSAKSAGRFTFMQHNYAASKLGVLYKHAVPVGSYRDYKASKEDENKSDIIAMRRFACPIMLDGRTALAFITLKISKGTNGKSEPHRKLYSIQLEKIEELRGELGRLEEFKHIPAPSSEEMLAQFNAAVKTYFEDVSKVLDENGEPLVVYHGSQFDFNAFDKARQKEGSKFGKGFYFTDDYDRARRRANPLFSPPEMAKREPMAVFLNIRDENDIHALKNGKWTEYVAHEPTQIKSATDNRGTFDAGNADITMSLDLDNGVGATQMSSRAGVEEEVCQQMLRSILAAEKMWKTTFKGSHDERESARGHMMGLAMGVYRRLPAGYKVRLEPIIRRGAVLERMIATGKLRSYGQVSKEELAELRDGGQQDTRRIIKPPAPFFAFPAPPHPGKAGLQRERSKNSCPLSEASF